MSMILAVVILVLIMKAVYFTTKPKAFKPVFEREIHGGIQRIFSFPNGYGASVVQHEFSYGGNRGLWELAVIKVLSKDPLDFHICYETHITNDVIGYLNEKEVESILLQISRLNSPLEVFDRILNRLSELIKSKLGGKSK